MGKNKQDKRLKRLSLHSHTYTHTELVSWLSVICNVFMLYYND